MEKGKFIVLYGANNLGKSTQIGMLVAALRAKGLAVQKLKYPIYDLEPTGPLINAALRKGLTISDEELQREFAQNRRDFEPQLTASLESGIWVVAEDYTGTGIAWGVTHNVPLDVMEEMNDGLIKEDLAICLDGDRFTSGIERGHRHEVDSDWERARAVHQELTRRYGWEVVAAGRPAEQVHGDIVQLVSQRFFNNSN